MIIKIIFKHMNMKTRKEKDVHMHIWQGAKWKLARNLINYYYYIYIYNYYEYNYQNTLKHKYNMKLIN